MKGKRSPRGVFVRYDVAAVIYGGFALFDLARHHGTAGTAVDVALCALCVGLAVRR